MIVIIGILAVALIPRLTGLQARARDTARIADLKQIQTALEFYASEHNWLYPVTVPGPFFGGWRGNCSVFGSYTTQWSSWWVPDLAPNYITTLPLDPKPIWDVWCYAYRSNGVDYMILAHLTVEWNIPLEYTRVYQSIKTFAIYTSWAKNR